MDNDVYFFFIRRLSGNNNVEIDSQIPGVLIDDSAGVPFDVFTVINSFEAFPNGNLSLGYLRVSDGTVYSIPVGIFIELRVVIIASSTSDRLSRASQEAILADLKTAGIDTSNYDEVITYYGLE